MTQDSVCETSNQQEQLAHIGAHLQDVREQRGLSLDQISAKTLIQVRLLRAIESGNLDGLPEPVYIRGFLKRYADYLDLDGGKVAASFPIEAEVQLPPMSWNTSAAAQLRPLHLYAAYVILIVAAVSGVSYLLSVLTPTTLVTSQQLPTAPVESANTDDEEASSAAPQASPEPLEETPESADTASTDAEGATSSGQVNGPVKVSLELVERSWLRIIVDGNEAFEGVLQEGTERTWTAESEVTVRAGNAGGVRLAINDQPAEIMGEPGSVLEKTFSKETSNASAAGLEQASSQ